MDELRKQRDQAYWERNQLVALLSKLFPSHLSRHEKDENWDKEWVWMVCIHIPTQKMLLPTGNIIISQAQAQARWHIHNNEKKEFTHLKWKQKCKWDGHTTEDKYARLSNYQREAAKFHGGGNGRRLLIELMAELKI